MVGRFATAPPRSGLRLIGRSLATADLRTPSVPSGLTRSTTGASAGTTGAGGAGAEAAEVAVVAL